MKPVGLGIAQASPSLALVKYWGKSDTRANLPATPSIAVTLQKLCSETRVWAIRPSALGKHIEDQVWLDGEYQKPGRFFAYFEGLREVLGRDIAFWAESTNNFPTAAGLASSSSGFAALTLAACAAAGFRAETELLSSLARLGSGSAARSLYGGFTLLPAASESALQLHSHEYWDELRLVVVRIQDGPKDLSSREAMERTRLTSPYYDAWVNDAQNVCNEARVALENRDIEALGNAMRVSYLRMFATMFSSRPPYIYWKPDSLRVIHLCEELRNQGLPAWETMDAGPQVKILTTASAVDRVLDAVSSEIGEHKTIVDRVGSGPRVLPQPEILQAQAARELSVKATELGLDLAVEVTGAE